MAYTAMATRATGYVATATDWNEIVDNFAAGAPDLFTTKGDLAIGTGANAAARLAVGTDGQVLTADSGEATGLKWASISAGVHARAKVSSTKALASGSTVIIDYDTEEYDTGSDVTTGAAWKFTAPANGYYLVQASVVLESSNAWGVNEYLKLELFVDGSLYMLLDQINMQAAGTYQVALNGSTIVYLTATQYIDIRATQNSGSSINIASAGEQSYISISQLA